MNVVKYIFRNTNDFTVSHTKLDKIKRDCPIAVIPFQLVWARDSLKNKVKTIFKLKYLPNENLLQKIAEEIFMAEVFGDKEDLGVVLFDIMLWHQNRSWELDNLTESDTRKANALEGMTVLSRKRYLEYTTPRLKLLLKNHQPIVTFLIFPLVAKTPIRSIMYFIDIQSRFSFNSIRKAKHKYADDIISYLYEVLILNQKSANKLHSLVKHIYEAEHQKKDSILLRTEIDAISEVDTIITYLKASIEKNTTLVGYTFNIPKLEEKKEHKKRIKAIENNVLEDVKKKSYFKMFMDGISSAQIENLNNYRTGLLHKKGVSSNQPQEFYGSQDSYKSLTKMFDFLMGQHRENSILIIATLALLTDELVKLDKPNFNLSDLPVNSLFNDHVD
ncbi:hypothetical protein [Lentimicrobium sp. S6]|uniref:hypothetical protein n=1 Tax=Lentimicrobium sp. S6 TaxID=2735872 RepID=UPI001552D0BE|nr:hypothetical protein [Lentimicrobium sp. S6]NPD47598.1 hypothetical protein [Lentimicrobium sp. S6]